jgi:cytochrome c
MTRYAAALALGLCGLMIAAVGLSAQDATKKTIWEGVYTDAQAARGETTYKKHCTLCHRDDLRGNNDGGPPLRGLEFTTRWTNTSMKDMVGAISDIMPNEKPGSLSRQEYVDIVAFLFRGNGIPAGERELPVKDADLEQIIFTLKK